MVLNKQYQKEAGNDRVKGVFKKSHLVGLTITTNK